MKTASRLTPSLASVVVLFALCCVARAENWPGFRGPTGQGHSRQMDLPVEWGGADQKNVLWRAPLVGEGHASPIVWGDRIFICTVKWPDGVKTQAEREKVIPDHHVLCFRGGDGARLWDTEVKPGPWLRTDFRSGPGGGYAAPTPTTDGERVFVVFGSSVIAAIGFDGREVWRKKIEPWTFDVTIGSSPVLYGDTVLMLCAMAKKSDSRLVAYEKSSGEIRWRTPLPETGFAHSTPLLFEANERAQLVTVASGIGVASRGVQSFDPATGTLLWWCRGGGDAASAAFGSGIVYSDSGRGGPGMAIDPGGSGDVSDTRVKWRVDNVPEGIGSPVIAGGLVYRLHRPNVLKCWRAADGSQVYAKRLARLTSTWASPIVDAAGRMYLATAGTSYVIRAGFEFEVLAVNELGDPNHASPAVYGDRLILAGTRDVYCVGEARESASPAKDLDTAGVPARLRSWLAPQRWERDTDRPIVSLGTPGDFDDTHIFAPNVAIENGRFLLWYCGSRGFAHDLSPTRTRDERVFKLGLATSADGKRFEKHPNSPIFELADDRRSILTPTVLRNADGSIRREDGVMRMWFCSATLGGGGRIQSIQHATSRNGIEWSEASPPLIERAYAPSVIKTEKGYEMWYTVPGRYPWVMRHARSDDGVKWSVDEKSVLEISQAWEHDLQIYPAVVNQDGVYLMWYASYLSKDHLTTAIGFAASLDGLTWYKHPSNPVLRPSPQREWESHYVSSQSVMRLPDGSFRMWYASRKAPPFLNLYYALNTARWSGPDGATRRE